MATVILPRPTWSRLVSGALTLVATACAGSVTPDVRYVGAMKPVAASSLCRPSRAVLILQNGAVLFTPDETTWTLSGAATADGRIQATRSGIAADRQPYRTILQGAWTTTTATGTYSTPRCTFEVTLTKG